LVAYILRRVLISVPVLLVASFIVFLLVTWSGNPLAELKATPGISPATIKVREHELHLDEPVLTRYVRWIGSAAHGDLGESSKFHEPVRDVLARRLAVTFRLVFVATILGVLLAMAIGVYSAVRQYSVFDHLATFFAFVFFSMPVFWLAAVLKDVAIRINTGLHHRIFFTVGEATPNLGAGLLGHWSDQLGHLILPSLTLMLISIAGWSRYQRAAMLDVLHSDYVRTARAKGLSEPRVLWRHALRNALIPVVTIVALDFGAVLGGAVVTEFVFSWKGMGVLFIESLENQDVNVVLGWLLVTATLVVLFNLLADIVYGYLDPRLRRG
jgi:peptide/nickel transport system permease protein